MPKFFNFTLPLTINLLLLIILLLPGESVCGIGNSYIETIIREQKMDVYTSKGREPQEAPSVEIILKHHLLDSYLLRVNPDIIRDTEPGPSTQFESRISFVIGRHNGKGGKKIY